jgi:uncharacterized membrane protein
MNVNRRMVSAALATTAAALFATSAVITTANAEEVKVKCYGANACKGTSDGVQRYTSTIAATIA